MILMIWQLGFSNWPKTESKEVSSIELNFSNKPHNSDLHICAEKLSFVDKAK